MNGTDLCLAIFLCLLLLLLMFVFTGNDIRETNYRNAAETNDAIRMLNSYDDDDATDDESSVKTTESFSRNTAVTARKPTIPGVFTKQKSHWTANPRVNNNILGVKSKPVKYNKVPDRIDKEISLPRWNNYLMRENKDGITKAFSPINRTSPDDVNVPYMDMERDESFKRRSRISQLPARLTSKTLKWN